MAKNRAKFFSKAHGGSLLGKMVKICTYPIRDPLDEKKGDQALLCECSCQSWYHTVGVVLMFLQTNMLL